MAFEKDPNRDRKRVVIVFILCLVFFAVAFKCGGQCETRSKPYANYPTITRISACQGINYESNGKSVFVGIYADSIKPYKYIPILYVVLPKGVKAKNPELLITFDNDDMPLLIPQIVDIDSGYAEFACKDPYFHNIRNNKIKMIQLINDDISYTIFQENIDLFYRFAKKL